MSVGLSVLKSAVICIHLLICLSMDNFSSILFISKHIQAISFLLCSIDAITCTGQPSKFLSVLLGSFSLCTICKGPASNIRFNFHLLALEHSSLLRRSYRLLRKAHNARVNKECFQETKSNHSLAILLDFFQSAI